MKNLGLIPLRNFGVLDYETGLFRSAQPQYEYEYQWLKNNLGIKTIINLRSESNHDNRFAEKNGMKVITFNIPDHHPPTKEQAQQFIQLLQEQENFPLLFHCAHGHGRTSTFSVLAKVAMGWELEDAVKHEQNEFKYNFKHASQTEFLTQNYG